LAEAADLNSAQ